MPKRNDIKSILLIGSGPIVIGQACEFDYSGTQAIKALKEEGYRVILVNSNPATIMTDPELADATYIEPINADFVERVIAAEKPDAILPTMGGQTALNIAIELGEQGILEKYNCELIGASIDSIKMAEDRDLFKTAMQEIGLESAKSRVVTNIEEAADYAKEISYPMILRPSRTLGGSGGGIVNDESELAEKVGFALQCSPNSEVLIEESLLGWKEFEMEVMRDLNDNVVIVCSIENVDPMGVHTGDSITVAPIQTLTDKEYQYLRDASIAVLRKIGVDTGGSNVQFAVNPEDGRVVIIEMNPRVSRSSALASKATGFPIAKIAAKLAVGYTLDEIPNDITKETPASFEPSIDYVVCKIPRFNFEKFPLADPILGTQMKSVGEVMSFGKSFKEALLKAISSLEDGTAGFDRTAQYADLSKDQLLESLEIATPDRIWKIAEALRQKISYEELFRVTAYDLWFLNEMQEIINLEESVRDANIEDLTKEKLYELKEAGLSDQRLAQLLQTKESEVRKKRLTYDLKPVFKAVDTCAAEFRADTPYLYSSYDSYSDAEPSDRRKVIILGSGPNRIGQGIEFDYCCVHAVQILQDEGYETIMLNCNPETVSTDYDTADRLYFEPLTFESVMSVIEREQPEGVILQFGGQTPLKLARSLADAGVPILGTSVDSIEFAEDRKLFNELLNRLKIKQPKGSTVVSVEEAIESANEISYPIMIRPSFVLGGRAMKIVFNEEDLLNYMQESVDVSDEKPVLLDKYLHNAIEVDVDLVSDGTEVVISGIMEHIERAGIHSGDSSCCLPPPSLPSYVIDQLKNNAKSLAKELNVVGLMNVQFAVTKGNEIYIIEANPRASRTVPFVSKATGIPWAKRAAQLMVGRTIQDLQLKEFDIKDFYAVKACVFPFSKFKGVDTILGPEMKSTGEVMGVAPSFSAAFAKAQFSVGNDLSRQGNVFISVMDQDKKELVPIVEMLNNVGFKFIATAGTADFLREHGYEAQTVNKVREGSPHVVDYLKQGKINLVINTPEGSAPLLDSRSIRTVANEERVPCFTTMAAAFAVARAIDILQDDTGLEVRPVNSYYAA